MPDSSQPNTAPKIPYTREDSSFAYRQGWEAGLRNEPRDSNPYRSEGTGPGRMRPWYRGHLEGLRASRMEDHGLAS